MRPSFSTASSHRNHPPTLFSLSLMLLAALTPTATAASPFDFSFDFNPSTSSSSSLDSFPHHRLFIRQVATNLQSFTGNIGGSAPAPAITRSRDSGRPFEVDGSTFTDFKSAAERTCDNQFNQCANAANAQGNRGGFTVQECDKQKNDCKSFQATAQTQAFDQASVNIGPDPAFPEFDLICDA